MAEHTESGPISMPNNVPEREDLAGVLAELEERIRALDDTIRTEQRAGVRLLIQRERVKTEEMRNDVLAYLRDIDRTN